MRSLIVILISLSILAPLESHAKIPENKFMQHMVEHRMIVEEICKELIKDFPGLPVAYAMALCRAHDLSKVRQDPPFLRKHQISLTRSHASYLGQIYGEFIPEEKIERGIIDTVNRVDDEIFEEIATHYKANAKQRRLAQMFEHVSDLVARGLQEDLFGPVDGIYERGRPMSRASVYFATNSVEAKKWTAEERSLMIKLSEKLENNPALLERLKNSVPHDKVEKKLATLLASSHYVKAAAARVKCLEAMVHALH